MVLSVEQLGNGAAFIVRESASNTTILLGCGEYIPSNVNDSEKKESFYEDDFGKGTARGSGTGSTRTSDQEPSRGRKRRHYLKALMDFGDQKSPDKQLYALDAILISDSRPASCWMLPYLTEKILSSTDTSIIMTHATRALSKKVISDLWYVLVSMRSSSQLIIRLIVGRRDIQTLRAQTLLRLHPHCSMLKIYQKPLTRQPQSL